MSEITVRIHTTEGMEFSTTMDSSDSDHITAEEETAALTKLARELNSRGMNVGNLSVDRIEVSERGFWGSWGTTITSTPSPSMFSGVARLFAPTGASGSVSAVPPAAPPVALPASPAVEGGITETDDGRFFTYNLTPQNQENMSGRVYDVYTSTGPGGTPVRWRRLHEGASRPWEFERSGAWTASSSLVPPQIAGIVRSTPPGWEMTTAGNYTFFSEAGGSHRYIRVSNAFDGVVEVGTADPNTHTMTFRPATSADALPSFSHLPLASATAEVRDGANTLNVTSAGTNRFMTEGEGENRTRWEVMVVPGANPGDPPRAAYRRRVDEFGHPLAEPAWQRYVPNGSGGGEFRNISVAPSRPGTHGAGGRRANPNLPGRRGLRGTSI